VFHAVGIKGIKRKLISDDVCHNNACSTC